MGRKAYIGVNGAARQVKRGYIGVYQNTVIRTHGLPAGYTELEWIEGTGTQYMDTGISGGTNAAYEISFNALSTVNVNYETYFGGAGKPPCPKLLEHTNSMVNSQTTGSNTAIASMDTDLVIRYDADGKLYVNGTHTLTYTSGAGWGDRTWRVFNGHEDTDLIATMRLYALKMWTDGALVRNFVPAKRNSDGAIGLCDLTGAQFYTNAGTGAFTAGPVVTDIPAGSYARRIRRGYIGVGGVARPCWGPGQISYHGALDPLGMKGYALAGASVGDYALFAGGMVKWWSGGGDMTAEVTAYNSQLTRSFPADLNSAACYINGGTNGAYALICGGIVPRWSETNTVHAYNGSLTRTIPTALSVTMSSCSVQKVGSCGVVGAGSQSSAAVNAYDGSLTRTVPTGLSAARSAGASAAAGGYAVFAGGTNGSPVSCADAYNAALTRTALTGLSVAAKSNAAASVGGCALFAGGDNGSDVLTTVNAYDGSLTRTVQTSLSAARHGLAGASTPGYALFAGGENMDFSTIFAAVDLYDENLVRTAGTPLVKGWANLAGASVGRYALFGGGSGIDDNSNRVEAYAEL